MALYRDWWERPHHEPDRYKPQDPMYGWMDVYHVWDWGWFRPEYY